MDETFGGKECRNELYEAVMKLVQELGGRATSGASPTVEIARRAHAFQERG
jgi:hypothetical protein